MDVVGYQGEAGAFSEEGALALFPEAERRPLPSIRKVFEAVEVGRAGWGLVPMDNSQAGSINETYDLFLRHGLHLVGQTKLESRPRPGRPWEYVFYVDVDAPASRPEMIEALAALSEHATFTRLLGSYAGAVQRR